VKVCVGGTGVLVGGFGVLVGVSVGVAVGVGDSVTVGVSVGVGVALGGRGVLVAAASWVILATRVSNAACVWRTSTVCTTAVDTLLGLPMGESTSSMHAPEISENAAIISSKVDVRLFMGNLLI
jgi:hypothetical protein